MRRAPAVARASAARLAVLDWQPPGPAVALAGDGARERVRRVLAGLPGVATFTVRAPERRVRVTYDPAQVTPEAIRERLDRAGLPDGIDPAHDTPDRRGNV